MDSATNVFRREFLVSWVIATGIGWPLALVPTFILAHIVNIVYPRETNLVLGLGYGAIIGLAQWIVMKKFIPVSSKWILASTIGTGVPFVVAVILMETGGAADKWIQSEFLSWLLIGVSGGLITGMLQINTLKPHFAKAGWWVFFSALGWGLAWGSQRTGFAASWILGGVILGVITGIPLLWMIKSPALTIPQLNEKQPTGSQ